MDSATIEKVATTVVIAGAAFAASKVFEVGWKVATVRPIPAEDSEKWLAPKPEARFGVPQLQA